MENMYQAPRDGEQLAPPPLDGQDAQARSLTRGPPQASDISNSV